MKQPMQTSGSVPRCAWAEGDPLLQTYHDKEWGVPSRDERYLFEMLTLEGAQAGLSWLTVLKKRKAYQQAFHHFDISTCARMKDVELEEILRTQTVVRHRQKIYSVRGNAAAIQRIQKEQGSFASYLWSYTQDKQIVHHWQIESDIPAKNELSECISRDLKKKGFLFVGPVIIYSFLQAIGIVNDHVWGCSLYLQE